jgi:hypothetical protein
LKACLLKEQHLIGQKIDIHICPQDFSKQKFYYTSVLPMSNKIIPLFISNTSCKEDRVKGIEDIEKRGATKPVKTCRLTQQMARQSRTGFLVLEDFLSYMG